MKRSGPLRALLVPLLLAGCQGETVIVELDPSFAVSRGEVATEAPLGTGAVTELVKIINGTDGTLRGISAEVQIVSGTGQWLTATLDQTTATREQAATLRIQANPDNLGIGSYEAAVVLRAESASNGPFRIRVQFGVRPRPPARVELLTSVPSPVANGAPLGAATVRLLNALGEPTPVAGVVVSASLTGGGSLSGNVAVQTDANGRATFPDLVIRGLAGPRTLVFGASGLTSAAAAVTLVAGPAARLVAGSPLSQTVPAGTPVPNPPLVSTQDESGNPVGGVSVSFTPSAGSTIVPVGPVVSGADGNARLTNWVVRNSAGANTVIAAAAGLAGSPITFTATGQVGPPVALVKVSGDGLVGIVSTTLGTPHVVRVTDGAGNGVQGVTVSWTVAGGGSVSPATTVTDASGQAQATRTLGPAPGPVTTTATATLGGGPVSQVFAVTAATTGPAQIVKVAGDGQLAPAGTVLPVQLAVRVLDALNAALANVTVSWTTTDPTGSFPSGATSQTDATGLAVATWRLGTATGTQTAQAAVGGPPPATFTATAQAGAVSATLSTIVASPSLVTAGSGTAGIVVTARDASGNPVSGATVTLALTGGSGNLAQPVAPTNASGVATGVFSGTTTGTRTISATVGGTLLSQTATITVNPGPPAILAATTAAAFDVRFGQTVAPSPAVLLTDALGNPIPFTGVTYTRLLGASQLNGGPGPVSVSTNGAGVATIGSWFVQPVSGAVLATVNVYNRLRAAASGTNTITFEGTGDVYYAADISPAISAGCSGASCHPANGSLSYAMLVTGASPATHFVAAGDTLTINSTYNRLLAKIGGATSHTGGTFNANIVTLFAAWVKQGARP